MLPQVPSLLLNPDRWTLERLLALTYMIECPKEDIKIRNHFLEHYVHCDRLKVEKRREKEGESYYSAEKIKK